MATRAEMEALMSAYSKGAPTMSAIESTATSGGGYDPRQFGEALLVREARQEDELEAAQRLIYGKRCPLELLRQLALVNVRLLAGALGAIDNQREWEASMVIQYRSKALMARLKKGRAEVGQTSYKARARWNQVSTVVSRLPMEQKKKRLRERLKHALDWCKAERSRLQQEAREVYRGAAAKLLRRVRGLKRRLSTSEYTVAVQAGPRQARELPRERKHPIYATVRADQEEVLDAERRLEHMGSCLLHIYGLDISRQADKWELEHGTKYQLPHYYVDGEIPQTLISGVRCIKTASLGHLNKQYRSLGLALVFAASRAEPKVGLDMLSQLARGGKSLAMAPPPVPMGDHAEIEAAEAARQRARQMAMQLGGLTKDDLREIRTRSVPRTSSGLTIIDKKSTSLEAENDRHRLELQQGIVEVHEKTEALKRVRKELNDLATKNQSTTSSPIPDKSPKPDRSPKPERSPKPDRHQPPAADAIGVPPPSDATDAVLHLTVDAAAPAALSVAPAAGTVAAGSAFPLDAADEAREALEVDGPADSSAASSTGNSPREISGLMTNLFRKMPSARERDDPVVLYTRSGSAKLEPPDKNQMCHATPACARSAPVRELECRGAWAACSSSSPKLERRFVYVTRRVGERPREPSDLHPPPVAGAKPLYDEVDTMLAEAHQVIEAWEEKNSMRTGSANANETVDAEAAGNVAEMNVAELVRRAVGACAGIGCQRGRLYRAPTQAAVLLP